MDDGESTPISSLNQPPPTLNNPMMENTQMNYNPQVPQNTPNSPQQPQQMPPPPPTSQMLNAPQNTSETGMHYMNNQVPMNMMSNGEMNQMITDYYKDKEKDNSSKINFVGKGEIKEFILIFILFLIFNSSMIYRQIQHFFPRVFQDNQPTMIGIALSALFVSISFILIKKFFLK